jgi:hypothetical protein
MMLGPKPVRCLLKMGCLAAQSASSPLHYPTEPLARDLQKTGELSKEQLQRMFQRFQEMVQSADGKARIRAEVDAGGAVSLMQGGGFTAGFHSDGSGTHPPARDGY